MDTEKWNAAEERRLRKLQQIKQLLSIVLGPDADLNQETEDVIKQWEETVEMEVRPPSPKTPLQCLLREYHDICEDINDIEAQGWSGRE
jgi:CRISPR/Cas system-associated exonuclease Cas4 (RecB family)